MSFPKIIWQTHNYKYEWRPQHLIEIANTWINLNPGWEYRYHDQVQREEVVKAYPEVYEFYKYQMPQYQSDIWRYIVTYEYGGCYADMDSICRMPLDYMIETIGGDPEIIVVPEENGNMGNNCNYLVKPKSAIMKDVVDHMIPPQEKSKHGGFAPFNAFVTRVYASPNISKLFNAAFHGNSFKDYNFSPNHTINYYGTEMNYRDFLAEHSLKL